MSWKGTKCLCEGQNTLGRDMVPYGIIKCLVGGQSALCQDRMALGGTVPWGET